MLNNIKSKKQSGFTIIEVMIVLAIAALILLVVLLAVPALQRNSRNTTIKNDVSAVAGAINTFESDNGGTLPTYLNGTGSVAVDTSPTATPNRETAKVQGSTAVSTVTTVPTAVGSASGQLPVGTIQVVTGQTCSTATGGTGQSSARAAAIYYAIEATTNKLACQDS